MGISLQIITDTVKSRNNSNNYGAIRDISKAEWVYIELAACGVAALQKTYKLFAS